MIDVVSGRGHPPSEMRKSGWIGIRISESDKQLLQDIAESEGRSLANLCLFIIREYVERHTRQGVTANPDSHKISHPHNPDTETVKNEAKTRARAKAAEDRASVHQGDQGSVRVLKERKSNGKVHKH